MIPNFLQMHTTVAALTDVFIASQCLLSNCLSMFSVIKRAVCICAHTLLIYWSYFGHKSVCVTEIFYSLCVCWKYTYVFVDFCLMHLNISAMSQNICCSCEAVCNSISKECPSCGTRLEARAMDAFNPLPFIAAVCASFLMVGVMIGAATWIIPLVSQLRQFWVCSLAAV